MKASRLVMMMAALVFALTLTPSAQAAGPKGDSIVDVAIAVNSEGPFAGAFDTLIAAVLAADPAVFATLDGNGQHTVFAPTDDAFALLNLDESSVGDLPQDVLTDILLYHVVNGRRYAEDVVESTQLKTLYGSRLYQDGGVLTDQLDRDATIIVTDVEAANGIIHVIDAVVLPYNPDAAAAAAGPKGDSIVDVAIAINSEGPFAGAFDTLIAAVLAADPAVFATLDGNGQHTVFAPTDDAFAALGFDESSIGTLPTDVLTDILLYHVVKGRRYAEDVVESTQLKTLYGSRLYQNAGVLTDQLDRDATIIVTDVEAANGIIHAIDAVVLPYNPAAAADGPKGDNIVEVAIAINSEGPFAGAFDTLIAAVLAADPTVVATLSGNGQHTVFAPTDDAFAGLGLDESSIGDLPKDVLTDILLYHVVKGRRYAEDVVESTQLKTLYGSRLYQNAGVLTDQLDRDATIIVTDVEAANGIIHAINAVVLPYNPAAATAAGVDSPVTHRSRVYMPMMMQ